MIVLVVVVVVIIRKMRVRVRWPTQSGESQVDFEKRNLEATKVRK